MAFLRNENGEIIIDAVLTKYGREKLSRGSDLGITKFAMSDDGIDYNLYNTTHPQGEGFYDVAIVKLPLLEANPVSNAEMMSLLYTNTENVSVVSTMNVQYPDIFNQGINTTNVIYSILPVVTPKPLNDSMIYFVAEMDKYNSYEFSLEGIIDENIGYTNQMHYAKMQFEKEIVPTSRYTNLKVVGHSFNFVVKNLPRYDSQYQVRITAYGLVNSQPYNFNINVKGKMNISGGNTES